MPSRNGFKRSLALRRSSLKSGTPTPSKPIFTPQTQPQCARLAARSVAQTSCHGLLLASAKDTKRRGRRRSACGRGGAQAARCVLPLTPHRAGAQSSWPRLLRTRRRAHWRFSKVRRRLYAVALFLLQAPSSWPSPLASDSPHTAPTHTSAHYLNSMYPQISMPASSSPCGPPAALQAVDASTPPRPRPRFDAPPRRDRLLHALEGLAKLSPMAHAMGFGARVCWVRPRRADWPVSRRSLAQHTRPFGVVLGPVAMDTALPSGGMSTTRAPKHFHRSLSSSPSSGS